MVQSEKELTDKIIGLLIEKGYPRTSIRTEVREKNFFFDIGIYSENGVLLQVFEFKRFPNNEKLISIWNNAKEILNTLDNTPEFYIVPIDSDVIRLLTVNNREIYEYKEGGRDFNSILNYNSLLPKALNKRLIIQKYETNILSKSIKKCCWLFAGFVILYIVLSHIYNCYFKLSYELLAFSSTAFILIIGPRIFPYIKLIKIWGVEIQLLNEELRQKLNQQVN